MRRKTHKLSVGEWVEVRSKEEILRTLDRHGQLDGMPFMPEMFAFCGKQFRVYKGHTRPAIRFFRFADGASIRQSIWRRVVMDPPTAAARPVA